MTHRPRLLFLSQTLPYPPDTGAKIRTYHLLRQLSRHFDITALCFYRAATLRGTLDSAISELRRFAVVEAFPIPQEQSRLRRALDHLQSLALGKVYTRFIHRSTDFKRRLSSLLAQNWDLIHADSLDLSGYFHLMKGSVLVCGHHDVQSDLLRRRAKRVGSLPQRWYLKHQSHLMLAEERRWCPQVSMNLVVSERDERLLKQAASTARFTVIPNGVDSGFYQPVSVTGDGCLFVGAAGWFPNRDAMMFFCAEVLPHLRVAIPDVTIRWVGGIEPEVAALFSQYHIEILGHVPDTRQYLAASACVIVPLLMGGGTRIKILEAWAMGKAVVSTTIGCEGLAAHDGRNILVRDHPAAFADAVVSLLKNPSLRVSLGRDGRRTAEATYDWNHIGGTLNNMYDRLVATR